MGHVFEYVVERRFVELSQTLFGRFTKKNVAGGHCHVEIFFGMNHYGNLFGQSFLERAATRVLLMLLYEGVDGGLVEVGEYLDIAFGVVVTHVEPELIECVWRRAVAIEPDVSALGLTEFLTIGLGDERTSEAESFGLVAQRAADEFRSGRHVAPLVVSSQLQTYAVLLIQIQKIVALEQLIGKFGERQSVAGLAVEALLHAVLGHHVVDGDVFAYLSREIEEGKVLHPVVVVDEFGLVRLGAIKVEEL